VHVEAVKELGEEVRTVKPEEEDVIDKTQPEAGLLESRMKEVLFKEAHQQISIGRVHSCAHGSSVDLEI
jgi:hypothetical protein